MRKHEQIFIDGQWVAADAHEHIEVVHATTEQLMGSTPACDATVVDRAVTAARAAFESWSRTEPAERAAHLRALGKGLAARTDEIAEIITGEVGMPLALSRRIQAGLPASLLGRYAELLERYPFESEVGSSLLWREPAGVVGCITPWNYPLYQVVLKLAPALAAGCTVVLKPSEVAPLSAYVLAEVADACGLPPGVLNLVSGRGSPVGEAIAAHPGIDMVSFTGSTRGGKRVAALAAATVKRVALELGGKSASIVLDDADQELAIKRSVSNCLLNSGQTCSAWTRLLVPEASYQPALAIAKRAAEKHVPGDPFAEGTRLGPLVSAAQRERVRDLIAAGLAEGASLVIGGTEPPAGLDRGFFVRPTVFSHVESHMRIAQEEIFGPVLCVMAYRDEEHAVHIANDTSYGLSGAVWSADTERAKRLARRLRTGQVDINGGRFNPDAPFGGYRQSGIGRELGVAGLEEYLEVKALQL